MHPYSQLKLFLRPVFERTGHKEISEELRSDVFGNAWFVFDNGRTKIRLVWDGKDGCGYIQTLALGDWEDIDCYLTEGDLESDPPNRPKIAEFLTSVELAAIK